MPGGKKKKTGRSTAKKKAQRGGRRKMLKGDGIFDWIKGAARTVYDKAVRPTYDKVIRPTYEKAIRPAYEFTRDHKLLSKGLGAIGTFAPGPLGTLAKAGAVGASLGGLGRKRKMKGAGAGGADWPRSIMMKKANPAKRIPGFRNSMSGSGAPRLFGVALTN